MTEGPSPHLLLEAPEHHRIRVCAFPAPAAPAAVIQVVHGLGEYSERYDRFARAARERRYAVVAHDHRGHGPLRKIPGFFARESGWDLLVSDTLQVHEWIEARHPGLPRAMLGHSMGSYIAQNFAMLYGTRLAALLLSGSSWPSRAQLLGGHLLARLECLRLGSHHVSPLLEKLGFAAFNRRFEPARTGYEWLSRDAAEVDRYIADPLVGGPFTAGLWRDLTGGLLRITSDTAVNRVPSGLPILISGGANDPVGGDRGMGKLALHYAQTGHARLKVKIYPGGRHEMLNDTHRDEVTTDWLAWLDQVL